MGNYINYTNISVNFINFVLYNDIIKLCTVYNYMYMHVQIILEHINIYRYIHGP